MGCFLPTEHCLPTGIISALNETSLDLIVTITNRFQHNGWFNQTVVDLPSSLEYRQIWLMQMCILELPNYER